MVGPPKTKLNYMNYTKIIIKYFKMNDILEDEPTNRVLCYIKNVLPHVRREVEKIKVVTLARKSDADAGVSLP